MPEHRQRDQSRELGIRSAREFLLDEIRQHRCQSFGRLERDVADKTIAHHDIGGALEDVVAFHVAVKVDQPGRAGSAQQFAGLFDRFAAFDGFFTDVEQAHTRVGLAFHRSNQRTAHHGELKQVVGSAIDIGAQVEHRGVTVTDVGHHAGDGRAINALERLEQITRKRHQCARVAGRNTGLGGCKSSRIGLDQTDRDPQRRVFLAPQGHLDRIVHLDDLGRRHDAASRPARRFSQRLGATDEDQLSDRMRVEKRT